MTSLGEHWPLFGLRLRTGALELRFPTDEDLAALADLATAGVHPPESMPFVTPWTDLPPGELERGLLQFHWGRRAGWSPQSWGADLVVLENGEIVGAQGIGAKDFAVTRTVVTGSWLGRRYQGQGIGTGMRHAVLALAFEGLAALEAHSGAFEDNPQSAAVSRKIGYLQAGRAVHARRGERAVEIKFVLDRATWERSERPVVHIEGLEPCRALFGI